MSSQIFQSSVRTMSLHGTGVLDHPNGKVYFAPGVWMGDEGLFEVVQDKKNYGMARLKELIKPSPYRVDPPCKFLGFNLQSCGGCPWMMASYESQLQIKQALVLEAIQRSKVLCEEKTQIFQIQPSPKIYGYRNRARVKSNGKILGYYAPKTHNLIDIKECIVLDSQTSAQFQSLRDSLPGTLYKEEVFFDLDSDLEGMPLPNAPRPFKQANEDQNAFMQSWVLERLQELPKNLDTLELFCGSGNFTKTLSSALEGKIVAVEGSADSIQILNSQQLPQVVGVVADLYRPEHWERFLQKPIRPQLLVLDPPRSGFPQMELFLQKCPGIGFVLYVSCDFHSYQRDARALISQGFVLEKIQPVDQFPHTPHIETLSFFRKRD